MPQQDVASLQTVGQLLEWAARLFDDAGVYFGHGTDNAWDEALLIITHVMEVSPFVDQSFAQNAVSDAQKERIVELVQKRVMQRIPVPYLIGEAWFAGLKFQVNSDVLIPRSPIAELIENGFYPWVTRPPERILDLCTGSGCIGIASAHAFPESQVVLSDISQPALAVAEKNIRLHNLADRVQAVHSDLFDNLQGQQFDLIISNSPYVDARDFREMPEEYRHEPELALSSGQDGLDFTRRLLDQTSGYLSEGGVMVAEVGNSWVALEKAFPRLPFTWVEFIHGGHGVFVLDKNQLGTAPDMHTD